MNVCQTLICFFFLSALWNTDLINAQNTIHTETEGGNITVVCSFSFSGTTKFFCKNDCEDGDILIQTEKNAAQRGRYSIEYEKGAFYEDALLYVSIRNLTKSDSGRYRCRLARLLSSDFQFEIRVTDAPTSSDPNWILPPVNPTPAAAQTTTGVVLYVRLTLVVMFIVLSTAVVMFYRKRARELREAPVEPEYVNVTETNRVYEEIREEDRQSRSPPVEMSTIHTFHCSQFSEQD